MKPSKPFAEVLESSLTGWVAQSWQWDIVPAFGSIVTVVMEGRIVFGVVHQIQTGSMDSSRVPFAYQKTETELRAEHPQIFEFLKTSFSCVVLGYQEQGAIYALLAPEPVKIHAFVTPLNPDLAQQFFASHDYLNVLFGHTATVAHFDELLLALLKQFSVFSIPLAQNLDLFIQRYSLLIGNDYRRMKLFLNRVEQLI